MEKRRGGRGGVQRLRVPHPTTSRRPHPRERHMHHVRRLRGLSRLRCSAAEQGSLSFAHCVRQSPPLVANGIAAVVAAAAGNSEPLPEHTALTLPTGCRPRLRRRNFIYPSGHYSRAQLLRIPVSWQSM